MKELRKKAFKFRLNPTKEQCALFTRYAGCARYVFNVGLSNYLTAIEDQSKLPNYYDAAAHLTFMKAQEETAWLKEVHSQVLQQALLMLYGGINKFYNERGKNKGIKLPKFKKKGKKESFRYPQNVKVEGDKVFLPKIGWVKYRNSRALEGEIKQAVIKKEAGYWYITLFTNVMIDTAKVPLVDEEAVGIDVGITSYAALSTGEVIKGPKYLKRYLAKLRFLQRRLARKKKFSANWKKEVVKIQGLHARIKNLRNDFLHKLSTLLSKNHGAVCVESLNIQGMVKNRRLAQSISDASWGRFISFLAYKCDWKAKHFVKVPRFFPSSKLCSECSSLQDMPLEERIYLCNTCGLEIGRDLNASINIRMAGLSILKACGANDVGLRTEAGIPGF